MKSSSTGPTIRGKPGDTLVVHFYNQLPVEPGGYFRYEFKLLHASLLWYHPHIRTNVQVEKGL